MVKLGLRFSLALSLSLSYSLMHSLTHSLKQGHYMADGNSGVASCTAAGVRSAEGVLALNTECKRKSFILYMINFNIHTTIDEYNDR